MKNLSTSVTILLIVISLSSLVSYFENQNWIIDLFTHFQFQYLIILVLGTLFLILLKHKIALFFIPLILFIFFDMAPFYFNQDEVELDKESLSILSINLLSSNGQFEDVNKEIQEKESQIVVLQEFTELWEIMIEDSFERYPYRFELPRQDNFGIAIYSKVELSNTEVLYIGESGVPSIKTTIMLENKPITIIGTHPLPPVGNRQFELRNTQFLELAKIANLITEELIVIGDLNSTSFSPHFKRLLNDSYLKDTRLGFGLLNTWPTWFLTSAVTLDHCLISDGLQTKSRVIGNDVGSDHLPIFVDIVFKN